MPNNLLLFFYYLCMPNEMHLNSFPLRNETQHHHHKLQQCSRAAQRMDATGANKMPLAVEHLIVDGGSTDQDNQRLS